MAADIAGTGARRLTGDDQLLDARIRSQMDFYRGTSDEQALITNILRRRSRYNDLMLTSAVDCRAAVLSVKIHNSVEDIADQ